MEPLQDGHQNPTQGKTSKMHPTGAFFLFWQSVFSTDAQPDNAGEID
jgi:hypothetical protein